jgi:ABC-2 type transport system permease protein
VANAPVLLRKTLLVGTSVPEKRNVADNQPEDGTRRDSSLRLSVLSLPMLSLPARACSPPQHEVIAPPPYPYERSNLVLLLRQYVLVIRVLLAEYRRTWFGQVFIGFLVPIGLAFFLKAIGNVTTTERAIFLLGGNLATSIAFGPTSFLILKVGWAKQFHEFDYWVALPLPKLTLLFGLVSVAFAFALPGIVGIYVFENLFFGLSFTNILLVLPLIPLGVLSIASLGALLGCHAPNGQTASNMSNMVIVFVGFLSPMMIPASVLPLPLRIISIFVPTTYVADAFRAILANHIDMYLTFDVLIILLFSGAFLALAYLRLDWRSS